MSAPDRNALSCSDLAARGEVGLLLIRHGSTAWNRERRLLGRTDLPLDEGGRAEALALAQHLADQPLAAIYASPLRRATETAQALALGREGVSVVPAPGLVELDQGELDGKTSAELLPRYADFFAQWREDPTHTRVPGGETLGECQARALPALQQIAARHMPGELVAVVLHQMVLSATLCAVLQLALREYGKMTQKNTAFNLLGARQGQLRAVLLNQTPHLEK